MFTKTLRPIFLFPLMVLSLTLLAFLYFITRNKGTVVNGSLSRTCPFEVISATQINFDFLIGSSQYGNTIVINNNDNERSVAIINSKGDQKTSSLTDNEYKELVENLQHFLCNVEPWNGANISAHSPIYKMVITLPDRSVTVTDNGIVGINKTNYDDSRMDYRYLPSQIFGNILSNR